MPWNVKNQFTGRFTLRFRYRYVDQKAASGKSGGLKLMTRLDTIDAAGNHAYYGTAPKAGWTNYGSWETYEYQIIAQSGVAEPVYVTLHASLQDATKESADYYLIDDVEVLNEKGECVMSGGTFDNVTPYGWLLRLVWPPSPPAQLSFSVTRRNKTKPPRKEKARSCLSPRFSYRYSSYLISQLISTDSLISSGSGRRSRVCSSALLNRAAHKTMS